MAYHQGSPLTNDMNIGADEKKHIARYLKFLLCGERIAHSCSARQAKLCDDKQMKQFLLKQSRQEKFHAMTFQSGILFLAPKGVNTPAKKHTEIYSALLDEAIANHDLLSSVIGLQVILEGMGEVALSRLDFGMKQRDAGLQKLRRAILAQEDAHHDFGLQYLDKNQLATRSIGPEAYLAVIGDMLSSMQNLFEFFDEDSDQYIADFRRNLPDQVYRDAISNNSYA